LEEPCHETTLALKDNGGGVVIGSELGSSKVAKVNQHLTAAGLSQFADIRAGDALLTLRDVGGKVDLLFLDGWKPMYLGLLKVIMPQLRHRAVVLADDVTLFPTTWQVTWISSAILPTYSSRLCCHVETESSILSSYIEGVHSLIGNG